jgi:predicted DNA-binding antitoxin AbrB/MazE fold protein
MSEVVDAIYENGQFRPLVPVGLSEHQLVRLSIIPLPPQPDSGGNSTMVQTDSQRRAAIAARIPSDEDLALIAIPPPAEWLAEKEWE